MKKIKLILLSFFCLFLQNGYATLGINDFSLGENLFLKTETYLKELEKESIDLKKDDYFIAIKEYKSFEGKSILVGYLPLTKYLVFSSSEPLLFNKEDMILFAKSDFLATYIYIFKDWNDLEKIKVIKEPYEEKIIDLKEIKEKIKILFKN